MSSKQHSYFTLAQIIITLAGFLFIAFTFLWGLEKQYAVLGTSLDIENAFNEDKVQIRLNDCLLPGLCTKMGDYWHISQVYNVGKQICFVAAIFLTEISLIFWAKGRISH